MVTVREAGAGDLDALAALFLDMERHDEGEDAPDAATVRATVAACMAGRGDSVVLIAGDDPPLGFATLFRMFPGKLTRPMWYLKGIYVATAARGSGAAILRRAGGADPAEGIHRYEEGALDALAARPVPSVTRPGPRGGA